MVRGKTTGRRKHLPSAAALAFCCSASALVPFTASQASATLIVSDNFTSVTTAGTAFTTPSGTNLTGNPYARSGANSTSLVSTGSSGTGNLAPAAQDNNNGQGDLALLLASNGSYTKPTNFSVSIDLSPGNLGSGGSSSGERGVGIGFYSSITGTQFTNNFYTGFVLDNLGNLSLIRDTTTTGFTPPTPFATVAYGGTFTATNFYTLSFTVNTTTGNLSNVSLSGSSASYNSAFDSTTYFQDPATTYLSLYTSGVHAADVGYLDNLQLQSTPEPASLGFVGLASLAILARRKRIR